MHKLQNGRSNAMYVVRAGSNSLLYRFDSRLVRTV